MKDHEGKEITEQESPDKIIKVWCISPHQQDEYAYCVERDYHKAIKIAKDTVEYLMDSTGSDEKIEVKIWVIEMRLCDYLEIIENSQ